MSFVNLICSTCNKEFQRKKKHVKNIDTAVFCSRECYSDIATNNLRKANTDRKKESIIDFPLSDKWPIELQNRVHNRKKIWCIEYKGGACELCGYSKHPSALEFHHRNPESKKFEIGQSKNTISKKVLSKELDKCALLCANCHREVHAGITSLNAV